MSTKTFIDRQLLQIHQGGRAVLFKKMKRALNPQILIRLLLLGQRYAIRRLRVNLMMFALEYSPQNATYASGGRFKFPRKYERMRKTNNVLDDIVIINDGGFHTDEVNLIVRGKSFDFERSNIQENVYLLNEALPRDSKQHGENPKKYFNKRVVLRPLKSPATYVSADHDYAAWYMDNHVPLIFFEQVIRIDGDFIGSSDSSAWGFIKKVEKYCSDRSDSFFIQFYHKTKCSTIGTGSGIIAALTLAKLAKKLNIFGWDFRMESSPKYLNHKQALKALYNKELDEKMSLTHFEKALTHWLFASRLKELDHVNIHGYLNDVSCHPKLISKISRVYYED